MCHTGTQLVKQTGNYLLLTKWIIVHLNTPEHIFLNVKKTIILFCKLINQRTKQRGSRPDLCARLELVLCLPCYYGSYIMLLWSFSFTEYNSCYVNNF